MTEQQIQEMVEEVDENGEAVHIDLKGFSLYVQDFRMDGERVYWEAQRITDGTRVYIIRYADTPTDAIRAAIAMIDKLEAALQGDA